MDETKLKCPNLSTTYNNTLYVIRLRNYFGWPPKYVKVSSKTLYKGEKNSVRKQQESVHCCALDKG